MIDSLQDMLLGLSEANREIELLKLFSWVREEKITTVATIADSTTVLKAQLLEEYAVDCVIHLQQKMHNDMMTRYLRVIKLRGSSYGTNAYPFTIKDSGISILPVISFMKAKGVTLIFTELLPDGSGEYSNMSISSMSDTWIRLRQIENNGEFNRLINIVKSRGIKTSNQVKEFYVTDHGITTEEPYIGEGHMLFGSAKKARILHEQEIELNRQNELKNIDEQVSFQEEEYAAQKKIWGTQYKTKKFNLLCEKNNILNDAKNQGRRRADYKRLRE